MCADFCDQENSFFVWKSGGAESGFWMARAGFWKLVTVSKVRDKRLRSFAFSSCRFRRAVRGACAVGGGEALGLAALALAPVCGAAAAAPPSVKLKGHVF